MSRHNKPPSDDHLEIAAELRIGNQKWEAIAEKLHRSAETVRRWPLKYADRWRTAVHNAERRLAVDSEAEAVVVLRALLRDTDSKIRCYAARSLLSLRLELAKIDIRAQPRPPKAGAMSPAQLVVDLLENTSDEVIAQMVTAEYEREAQEKAAGGLTAPDVAV